MSRSMNCHETRSRQLFQAMGLFEDDEEAIAVSEHLAICETCRAEHASVGEALSALKEEPAVAAPDRDVAWVEINGRLDAEEQQAEVAVGLRCTYCHDLLARGEGSYCATCLAPHHGDCFAGHGRCAAPGCGETLLVQPKTAATLGRGRDEPVETRPSPFTLAASAILLAGAIGLVGGTSMLDHLTAQPPKPVEAPESKPKARETPETPKAPGLTPLEQALRDGRLALREGRWTNAVEAFTTARELDNDSVPALLGRSRAYENLNELDAAMDDAESATFLEPKDPETHTRIGRVHIARGNDVAAREAFETARRQKLDHAGGLLGLGLIAELEWRDEVALQRYDEVARLASAPVPTRIKALVGKARVLAAQIAAADGALQVQGEETALGRIVTQIDELAPEAIQRHLLLARVEAFEGRHERARYFATLALGAEPTWRTTRAERVAGFSLQGFARLFQPHFEADAARSFQRALELEPENPLVRYGAASLPGRLPEAAPALLAARRELEDGVGLMTRHRRRTRRLVRRALLSGAKEDQQRALAGFMRQRLLSPYDPVTLRELSDFCVRGGIKRGRLASDLATLGAVDPAAPEPAILMARARLAGLIDLGPVAAVKDFGRGIALAEARLKDSGDRSLKRRRELELALFQARFGLVRGRSRYESDRSALLPLLVDAFSVLPALPTGALDLRARRAALKLRISLATKAGLARERLAAERALSELEQAALDHAEALFKRGAKAFEAKRFDDATTCLSKAVELNPDHAGAHHKLALAYLKRGNFVPGILAFSKALELDETYGNEFYNKVYQVSYVVDMTPILRELELLVEEYNGASHVVFLRGFFYVAMSEFKGAPPESREKAMRDFARCLKRNPDHLVARTYRGHLYALNGEYAHARVELERCLREGPSSGVPAWMLARVTALEAAEAKGPRRERLRHEAIKLLQEAVRKGLEMDLHRRRDAAFDVIKDMPAYEALRAKD